MCPYVTVTDGCHEMVLNRLVFLRLSLFGNIRIRLAFSEVFDQKKSAEDFCFELTHICDEVLFCCLGHHRGYILLIKKQGTLCTQSVIFICGGRLHAAFEKHKVLFVSIDHNLWIYLSTKISPRYCAHAYMNINTSVFILLPSCQILSVWQGYFLICTVGHIFVIKRTSWFWTPGKHYEFIMGANESAMKVGQHAVRICLLSFPSVPCSLHPYLSKNFLFAHSSPLAFVSLWNLDFLTASSKAASACQSKRFQKSPWMICTSGCSCGCVRLHGWGFFSSSGAVQCVFVTLSSMLFHRSTSNAEVLCDVRTDLCLMCKQGPITQHPSLYLETLKRPLWMPDNKPSYVVIHLGPGWSDRVVW